ncbi:MAG TPA: hypothetical protein VGE44_11885 [Daejeonella sp.]|uniref:hypothetical protein n=1 Tax=Daejeonella sp. TaxID=2805397 RepID=UPI002EDB9166
MKKIIGITTALVLIVISLAYLYFSNLNVSSRNNDRVLSEIPADASLIFQYPNDKSLYEIFSDYTVFDTIIGTQSKKELAWLKELLISKKDLADLTDGQKVFLSFHPSKTDSVHFLWSIQLKQNISINDLRNMLSELSNIRFSMKEKSGNAILEINTDELNRPFYLCIDKGIARGSFAFELINRSIDNKTKKISQSFIKEINTGISKDANALAHLFINYNKPGFLKPYFRRKLGDNMELFESFSGYSSLELNYKTDVMMFNGISRIPTVKDSYIPIFLNQKPVKNTIKLVMPYNTASSIAYGISDYTSYKKDLNVIFEARAELDTLNRQIEKIRSETGINPERDMIKLWAKEMSTLHLSTSESLGIIKVSDGSKLQFLLDPMSSFYSPTVRRMNYSNLFYFYLGDPMKKFSKPFFTIIDNLLILSNSPSSIQRFLNDYNSGRLLHKTEAYIQFDKLVADQSNVSFVLYLNNAAVLLRNSLKSNYSQIFRSKNHGIKDLYAMSYQLTSNNEYFFTNFYTAYKNIKTASEPDLFVDSIGSN